MIEPVMDVFEQINHLSKSRLEADFLTELFGEHIEDALSGRIPIILYGAGSAGVELYECLKLHDINIAYFCDKNSELTGLAIQGVPIISFDELILRHKTSIIVISSNTYKLEIKKSLEENNFLKIAYIENNDQLFYYLQIYKWHYSLASIELDKEKIIQACQLFEDKKSKELFKKRIALLVSYADYHAFNQFISEFGDDVITAKLSDFQVSEYTDNYESYLYFNNDVLKLCEDEVLIDAGAFDGDSTVEFIKACEKKGVTYKHCYCVEADQENYSKLVNNMQSYRDITCLSVGLWSKTTKLKFVTSNTMFITEARIVDDTIEMNHEQKIDDSDCYINTISIDEQVVLALSKWILKEPKQKPCRGQKRQSRNTNPS